LRELVGVGARFDLRFAQPRVPEHMDATLLEAISAAKVAWPSFTGLLLPASRARKLDRVVQTQAAHLALERTRKAAKQAAAESAADATEFPLPPPVVYKQFHASHMDRMIEAQQPQVRGAVLYWTFAGCAHPVFLL
jgi:hypothetical protein